MLNDCFAIFHTHDKTTGEILLCVTLGTQTDDITPGGVEESEVCDIAVDNRETEETSRQGLSLVTQILDMERNRDVTTTVQDGKGLFPIVTSP